MKARPISSSLTIEIVFIHFLVRGFLLHSCQETRAYCNPLSLILCTTVQSRSSQPLYHCRICPSSRRIFFSNALRVCNFACLWLKCPKNIGELITLSSCTVRVLNGKISVVCQKLFPRSCWFKLFSSQKCHVAVFDTDTATISLVLLSLRCTPSGCASFSFRMKTSFKACLVESIVEWT